jgi:eukaryotic-like serine/threonine-protein kinase
LPEDTSNERSKRFADRYRVEAPIGEGAHATTWRGWDERLERPVAIKLLHDRLAADPVFLQRFQAEAKVAASVRQSNVVDIYDFGRENGSLYIVMQYIDGEDLKALIQRTAPIPVRDARRIIGNVLDGLQAIHAAGIVHRDIKPQNVLIGRDGVARVTDFGVAELNDTAGLTGEGLTIGTVEYMAPEQAQGLPLTPAADLYATGVMLYEMITGTLPFQGRNSRETMLQHINGQLTPPSMRLPERGITPTMDAVIGQSLAKDPARRFGTARAMKQAVGQALAASKAGAPTQATTVMAAQPQSQPPPSQQTTQYRPDPGHQDAGAGLNSAFRGLLTLLLIGALGVAVWGAFQLVDGDDLNFSLPGFLREQEAPTPVPTLEPTPEPTQFVPIQPSEPPTEAPVVIFPTEIPPQAPEPTSLPEATEVPADPPRIEPIVPIEPSETDDGPAIEPSGYDGEYNWH